MWDFTRLYAGGQSHVCSWLPNEEGCIHDWYDSGTLESRTCQIFRNGMRLNPKTSMSFYWKFQFSASEPSSEQFEQLVYMIADTIVADLWVLGNSRRRHRRWYCLVILGIHRRNHVYFYSLGLSIFGSVQTLWNLDWTLLDNIGCSSSVFEKYYEGLYCKSNGLGWFACFRDSVPAGSYNDPFLSSVISMVTPTWCHRANWGNPSWGQCWQTWLPNSHF